MSGGLGLILFGGLGYVLVYAAVANHGRFATQPWAGLLEDAYTGDRSTAPGSDTSSSSAAAPPDKAKQAATVMGGATRAHRPRAVIA